MRLWKQLKQQQQRQTAPAAPETFSTEPAGDPSLPGSAGYRGVGRLPKNAMPVSRFNFVRPDSKR